MASAGQRYIETWTGTPLVSGTAGPEGYQAGQLIVDLSNGKLYVFQANGNVQLVGGQT